MAVCDFPFSFWEPLLHSNGHGMVLRDGVSKLHGPALCRIDSVFITSMASGSGHPLSPVVSYHLVFSENSCTIGAMLKSAVFTTSRSSYGHNLALKLISKALVVEVLVSLISANSLSTEYTEQHLSLP